jgi:hypothetical protein
MSVNTTDNELLAQVLRQTDYTPEQALAKLSEHDQDVVKVVREYLTGSATKAVVQPAQKPSVNQQIYKEIRTMMDEAAMNYERLKRGGEGE